MARQYNELRAFNLALQPYLASKGWTNLTFKEGFGFDETIATPLIALTLLPLSTERLELSQPSSTKYFMRVIQVDVYMESESRVKAIWDDIADFMDEVVIQLPNSSGYMLCDTTTITGDVLEPRMTNPKVIRWRGIIRGRYEVNYLPQ